MTYVLIWLAVTATAVFVATAAVGSVLDQVTDAPTAMAPPTTTTTVAATTATELPAADTSTTTTTTTTTAPTVTTTSPPNPPPTTTTTTAPTVTTTNPPPATTTTTAPPPSSEIRSYDLVGGSVTVEIGSTDVHLAGASPKAGFSMDVEDNGPDKVEVEFKSDDHESHFSGQFEDGRFVPEIEESGRDEDDDD
jgi:hypothetical protein